MDPELTAFVQSTFRSLWAVETLLLVMKNAANPLSGAAIVSELRASATLVDNCVEQLSRAGLVDRDGERVRYAPVNADIDALARKLEHVYRERPMAIVHVVVSQERSGIQRFADAFRFKEPKE